MAINKNHEFEELGGSKCAVVEKNVSKARVDFLKPLLEFNHYTVVFMPSPAPKTASPPVVEVAPEEAAVVNVPVIPESFTVGVTDVMFNPINAIFGRLLKTPDGHVVTYAFWNQKEAIAKDEIPYFENII